MAPGLRIPPRIKTKSLSSKHRPAPFLDQGYEPTERPPMTSPPQKACLACKNLIHADASKCEHCDSYQSRGQRAFQFGNTFLALLVALVSVSGYALPEIVGAFTTPQSLVTIGGSVLKTNNIWQDDADSEPPDVNISIIVEYQAANAGERPGRIVKASLQLDSENELSRVVSVQEGVDNETWVIDPGTMAVPTATIALRFNRDAWTTNAAPVETVRDNWVQLECQVVNFDGTETVESIAIGKQLAQRISDAASR